MAVKTITIDIEAYDMLSRAKHDGQSFSQVIKEHFGRAPKGRDLRAALQGSRLHPSTIRQIDKVVARRKDSLAASPKLSE